MHTEKIADNIFRIPVKLPDSPLKELNSYFIKDRERSLLIDTGFAMDECLEALLNGINELGENPKNIDVFLTHMHSDHTGLAAEIIGEGRRILISETDFRWIKTSIADDELVFQNLVDRFRSADMPAFILDNMKSINPAIAYSPRVSSNQYFRVSDGHVFDVGGYHFRCIPTPGHTPGHMCLWDEGSGIMFTGDHILFDITPNITSWPNVANSLDDYLNSLRKISEYPVRIALPGHRKTGDFQGRINELLTHHEVRLNEVERLIRESPGSTVYDISGKMRWKIKAFDWSDFPAPQKIFAVGECMSHLDYLMNLGKIKYDIDDGILRYYYI